MCIRDSSNAAFTYQAMAPIPNNVLLNVDGSQQSYKMYNTGDSKSWKGYDVMLAEVFGGYKGDNPMASYIQDTGTDLSLIHI